MRRLQDDGPHSLDDAGGVRAEAVSDELIQMGMPAIPLYANTAALFLPRPHLSTSKKRSRLLEIKTVVTRKVITCSLETKTVRIKSAGAVSRKALPSIRRISRIRSQLQNGMVGR